MACDLKEFQRKKNFMFLDINFLKFYSVSLTEQNQIYKLVSLVLLFVEKVDWAASFD